MSGTTVERAIPHKFSLCPLRGLTIDTLGNGNVRIQVLVACLAVYMQYFLIAHLCNAKAELSIVDFF
jgi:hypothetical protein